MGLKTVTLVICLTFLIIGDGKVGLDVCLKYSETKQCPVTDGATCKTTCEPNPCNGTNTICCHDFTTNCSYSCCKEVIDLCRTYDAEKKCPRPNANCARDPCTPNPCSENKICCVTEKKCDYQCCNRGNDLCVRYETDGTCPATTNASCFKDPCTPNPCNDSNSICCSDYRNGCNYQCCKPKNDLCYKFKISGKCPTTTGVSCKADPCKYNPCNGTDNICCPDYRVGCNYQCCPRPADLCSKYQTSKECPFTAGVKCSVCPCKKNPCKGINSVCCPDYTLGCNYQCCKPCN